MGKIVSGKHFARIWETVGIPIFFVVAVFIFYSLLGYGNELQWHSLRKGLVAVILLSAISAVTGSSLKRKLWYLSYIILFMYTVIYPVIISLGRKGWITDFDFAAPYFLIAVSAASLVTLLLFCGQVYTRFSAVFKISTLLISTTLFLNTMIYAGYFGIYGTPFVAEDMLPIIQTTPGEARQFIEGQIGLLPVITGIVMLICFVVSFLYLTSLSKQMKPHHFQGSRRITIYCILLALFCIYQIGCWSSKSYPLHEYYLAKSYIQVVQRAEKEHSEVVKKLTLTRETEQTLPHRLPGTVIFIIGESENRDHMSAFNPSYPAETTPWLSQKAKGKDFVLLPNGYSNYPQTTPSLEMVLTGVNQYNKQKLESAFNIIDVAKAAGYDTWWLSNQSKVGDGTTAAGLVASWTDHHAWTDHPMGDDMNLLDLLKAVPKEGNHFIIIHLGGSHLRYAERVPADFKGIHIAGNPERTNEYDSTVLYTDHVMKAIFDYAWEHLNLQALVYSSDHGEDMVYSHGAGKFTYAMVRIPIFFYVSPAYAAQFSDKIKDIQNNKDKVFTNDLLYDTISGLIDADNAQYEKQYDLFSDEYTLSSDQALTKHGSLKISDDPLLFAEA